MYPAIREMDAVHSGTGVFYQAMPAVGADGKNIMKLIPVQMVNGQFVPTETSKPKKAPAPQKAVTIDIASAAIQMVKEAALNSYASQLLRKQASLVNQVDLNVRNSANKRPLLQPSVSSMTKVPQMATPATNCVSQPVTIPSQLPVTVKSPALPRGQYLQIPPNAQVRTVPASELPPGIKKQIFTSSAGSYPGSGVPNVVYVSPITTVDQGCTPPNYPALNLLEFLSKKSASTSCGPPPKPQLKLIPQVSQRPNSPIKWMIEEEDSSAAQALDALSSPSVTSEILRAVAVRENAHKPCDTMTNPASQLSQSESRQGGENALVMCNGKVFFVAKKCDLPIPVGIDDSPTKNTTVPSPVLTPDIQQIIIPDESDEVIDLCDDDDSSQQAVDTAVVTHLDEDNVIFVSYIPPKSDSGSAQDLILQTPKAFTKVTDQRGTSSSNSARRQKRLHGNAGDDALRRRESGQSALVSAVQNHIHAGGSAVINTEGSNVNSQQSTSTQHVGSLEVDVERESPAEPRMSDGSSGTCSRVVEDTCETENSVSPAAGLTSSPASESRPMADHLLRQVLGITADVRICLQKIDEASAGSVPAEPLLSESVRSVEDHQEATSRSKEDKLFLQDFSSPRKTDGSNRLVKRVKVLTEQELPADPATPGPHTLLQCSHLEQTKTLKHNSGQRSLKGTPCDVETKPLISYLEPIDEDFLSADENNPTDARPQTCVNLNTNTRRIGRTRKRTFCPCCITSTHDPATKSGMKSEEKLTTEQTSKRGGRTKSARKDVRTSGRTSWLKAKNKQNCQTYEALASERFSTTSMDPEDTEELQRLEQIRRLKELLREKEVALDLMRNSMS